MSVNSHYKSLIKAVEQYETLLQEVSEDVFVQSPADGGWSYSETFSHIFKSNLASLIAVEKCFLGTGILHEKRANWKVWAILFLGRLPPGKFKAPERLASMVIILSKEEAANLIVKFRKRLSELKDKVEKADKFQKVKHPRLGLLNARQWWRFIEIHTIHHTYQLKRIGMTCPDIG
ncbi:DinB family protein [Daejeonella sp.]|uniref:DinB family protein n=1 Tax=Daejeonella sp. TaxID=2805397 RepID=UPI0030C552C0